MQLPYFFQETLRAFSIKCISMLFHNTIYFIYNKQRDLEQTLPQTHNTENEETNAEAVKRMETEGKTRIKQTK